MPNRISRNLLQVFILVIAAFFMQAGLSKQQQDQSNWQFKANLEPYVHNYEWFSPIKAEGFTLFGVLAPIYIRTQLNEQFTLELGSLLHFTHQAPSQVSFLPYLRNQIQLTAQQHISVGNIESEIKLSEAIKYDIQRYLGKPANGIAYHFKQQQQQLNLWVNWLDVEQQQQAERFEAGVHYQIQIYNNQHWLFTQQAFSQHQGGQKTLSPNSIRSFWLNSQLTFQKQQHSLQLAILFSDYNSNISPQSNGVALEAAYNWQLTPHQQLSVKHFNSDNYTSLGEHPGYRATNFQHLQWALFWPLSNSSQLLSRLTFQWIDGHFATSQHLTIQQQF